MSLDRYEPLFFNANFKEAASDASLVAYRGELILQEGEVADANGRRPLAIFSETFANLRLCLKLPRTALHLNGEAMHEPFPPHSNETSAKGLGVMGDW